MAHLEDYNQMTTKGGYLITTESRIRQYVEINSLLIVRTQPKKGDVDYLIKKGEIICYDEYGEKKWLFDEEEISEISLRDNKLFFYNPSSMGYEYEIDYKSGIKLKTNIIK